MFGPDIHCSDIRWIAVRVSFVCGVLIALGASFSTAAFGQRQEVIFDNAPPPLLVASKDELARILAPADNEDKARLALEAMDTHLSKAEGAASTGSFDASYTELGHFCAIMRRTLSALLVYNSNGRQDLDALKRFDIGLRRFLLRLENLRGEMPSTHEAFAVKTIHYLQDTRDAALKPMFADNVVAVPNSDK